MREMTKAERKAWNRHVRERREANRAQGMGFAMLAGLLLAATYWIPAAFLGAIACALASWLLRKLG